MKRYCTFHNFFAGYYLKGRFRMRSNRWRSFKVNATQQADLFKQTFENPYRHRVDSQLATSIAKEAIENKESYDRLFWLYSFWQSRVWPLEVIVMIMLIFLVMKLTEKTSFPCYNYWQEETILFRSTSSHQAQARYTSRTIQNDVIHLYVLQLIFGFS